RLLVPFAGNFTPSVEIAGHGTILNEGETIRDEQMEPLMELEGQYRGVLYSGQEIEVARIVLKVPHPLNLTNKLTRCEYYLQCEEVREPNAGMAVLILDPFEDATENNKAVVG